MRVALDGSDIALKYVLKMIITTYLNKINMYIIFLSTVKLAILIIIFV